MKKKTILWGVEAPSRTVPARCLEGSSVSDSKPEKSGCGKQFPFRVVLLAFLMLSGSGLCSLFHDFIAGTGSGCGSCIRYGSWNGLGVSAQSTTTAGISGSVSDIYSNIVEAANVQVTNVATGARWGTITNRYGLYSISGLRPGEYEVMVSFVGYRTGKYSQIVLSAGQQYKLDVILSESENVLGEVDITASNSHFTETRTGQTYNVDSRRIELLPSADRSLLDYARLSPYSGAGNTMAGRDGRTTMLTIDGAVLNNSFGLSSALPGNGTPISIDAVDEAQIVIAPYDVRQSDFTGGGINVVTKAGTNSFKASAYTYFYNEELRGNSVDGSWLGERPGESRSTYGLTMGGPIVKDRLFWFVNAERVSTPGPITEWRLSKDGKDDAGAMVSRVTQEDMKLFSDALAAYGYDAGSTDLSKGDQTNNKILARIDWNIAEGHNLMLRYNWTGNTQWNTPNARSTVGTKAASERISRNAYAFRNNCYTVEDVAWSGVAELNSRIGRRMDNNLSVTVSDVSNLRGSESAWFPHIDIWRDGDQFMSAGYELFSNGTGNYVRTYSASDYIRSVLGHSTITAGVSYQYQKGATNYRMYGTGYYRYASLDDFINHAAPVAFGMTYNYEGVDDPASRTSFGQSAAFLQAETRLFDRLSVTYGIRADLMQYYERIETNELFMTLDFTDHYYASGTAPEGYVPPRIDTGRWPETRVQWSPRVGFNWDVTGTGDAVIRGGAGVFKGRIPLVFFTCVPNYSGMLQNTVMVTNDKNGVLSGLAGDGFRYDEESLRSYISGLTDASGNRLYPMQSGTGTVISNATVCGVDPEFRLPSVMKASLAADLKLPLPFPAAITVEGIWNKDINAVYTENLNIRSGESFARFEGADDRIDYRRNADGTPCGSPLVDGRVSPSGGAMIIRNTDKGYSWSAGVTLTAEPLRGLNAEVSYIHADSRSVSDMTGSALYSTWSNTASVNGPNEAVERISGYVIPDKVTAALTYSFSGRHVKTSAGVFYTGHTAGTYSYVYSNDMNGDGVNNDLIRIPASKEEIQFADNGEYTAAWQQEAFWAFVNQDRYLSAHKGGYAGAYAARMPWLNRFDLHVGERFKVFGVRGKANWIELSADLMNAANLINSKWGVTQTPSACNNGKLLSYVRTDESGRPVFTMATNAEGLVSRTFEPLKSTANCWYLQVGVRILFE
ncbi:MAG: TonB-dependent receptor [Bacteroidaceae bacterium]|nr:TonB-dependent receptor [Bacteroidaceae bacterium]